jgi:hypothetical protein
MSCGSPSDELVRWESSEWRTSEAVPGVRFLVRRPSLIKRAELTRRVRALVEEMSCRAGGETPEDRLRAAELEIEADTIYVEWGVLEVRGMEIDGKAATVAAVLASGPEALGREMAAAVRAELMLTGDERKN